MRDQVSSDFRASIADAEAALGDKDVAQLLTHGTMEVKYYAPRGTDRQTPHDKDELYIIISGHGRFHNGAAQADFGPGDVLFARAGVAHRFEDFDDDFATWVIFWGPKGGEVG